MLTFSHGYRSFLKSTTGLYRATLTPLPDSPMPTLAHLVPIWDRFHMMDPKLQTIR